MGGSGAVGRPRGRPPKTRAEIAAAARRVFRERGYAGATMDDIAAALGITKGSLYHYVETKEQLLFDAVLEPYRGALTHLRAVLADEDRLLEERLVAVVRRHLTNVVTHHPAIAIYLENDRQLPVPAEIRALDREYVSGVRQLLLAGMRDGSLRVQDPSVATTALLGMCNWFALRYEPSAGWDVDEVAGDFTRIFLHGMATTELEDDDGGG